MRAPAPEAHRRSVPARHARRHQASRAPMMGMGHPDKPPAGAGGRGNIRALPQVSDRETAGECDAVFLFLYFLFPFFLKKIYLFWKFTEIYPGRPAAGRPGPDRPAAGRQGLIYKKTRQKIAPRSLENRPPGSGAAGPGRPPAGRPVPPTLYKVLAAPHPLICLTKNPEKKKREGERGRGRARERQSGEALPDFQAGDYR